MKRENIIVTGYAKLPGGLTATELYKVVGVAILVNRKTGLIKEIECSLATNLAKEYVKDIIVGRKLNDISIIEKDFELNYFGSAKKAIISAIKIASEKFNQIGDINE
ncbi:DUF3870 domain-containing protein [Helicovermis profundi]|uniref:DUF3870 domain-containing protein n=1 Tax=Helicovermis profundi TaxID=3065157 RepID=A0AAU9EKQ5_9FIRM|nr:hypothetical protein HLPR_25140 [Clostridia bacterium S502]